MNLAASLARATDAQPDRIAIRLGDATVSYRELDQASARVAGLLAARGVGPGDPVAIMLPNVPQFAVVYFGVLRAGGVVVPMNPLLKAREIAYYLGDSGASVIFAWHTVAGEAELGAKEAGAEVIVVDPATFAEVLAAAPSQSQVVNRAGDDTAVILYTSGTTGRPKGAELTHANLIKNAEVTGADLLQLGPDDVIFGGPAAVPLLRADLHAQHRRRGGRRVDGPPALQPSDMTPPASESRRRTRGHGGCLAWPARPSDCSTSSDTTLSTSSAFRWVVSSLSSSPTRHLLGCAG